MFIQVFLYNMKCLLSLLLPPVEKIATLLTVLFTLLNDFLKTNIGSQISLFFVISSFISHCFKKLLKKIFLQNKKTTFE